MNSVALHTLSICTGLGGIERGIEQIALRAFKPVLYCEREISAAAIIAKEIESGGLPADPIWSDVKTLTRGSCARFLDEVGIDCITGGFPCQPFSEAGRKFGSEDPRHLWPWIVEAVKRYRPAVCFFENVPGLESTPTLQHSPRMRRFFADLGRAQEAAESARERWYLSQFRQRTYQRWLRERGVSSLLYCMSELEASGYEVAAGLFSAAEVGASHRRERLFILGLADGLDNGLEGGEREKLARSGTRGQHAETVGSGCERDAMDDTPRNGDSRSDGETGSGGRVCETGDELAHSENTNGGRARNAGIGRGRNPETGGSGGIPQYPPGPGEREQWQRIIARFPELAPASEAEIEPNFRGVAHGLSRADQLRAYGNAVVPDCAAVAFLSLCGSLSGPRGISND